MDYRRWAEIPQQQPSNPIASNPSYTRRAYNVSSHHPHSYSYTHHPADPPRRPHIDAAGSSRWAEIPQQQPTNPITSNLSNTPQAYNVSSHHSHSYSYTHHPADPPRPSHIDAAGSRRWAVTPQQKPTDPIASSLSYTPQAYYVSSHHPHSYSYTHHPADPPRLPDIDAACSGRWAEIPQQQPTNPIASNLSYTPQAYNVSSHHPHSYSYTHHPTDPSRPPHIDAVGSSRWAEIPQQQPTNPASNLSYTQQAYNVSSHHPHSYSYTHHPGDPPRPSRIDAAGSDAVLRPPGVDVYTPHPYASHSTYEPPASYWHQQQLMEPGVSASAYFHEPRVQQQSRGANEPVRSYAATDTIGYASIVGPPNRMEQMVGANSNPTFWNNPRIHPSAKGSTMKKGLKTPKAVPSAWCELCKVDCTSEEILNKHKLGKKHMKILKKQESINAAAIAILIQVEPKDKTVTERGPFGESAKSKKKKQQISAPKPGEDFETKREKLIEGGTSADLLRVCTVCNVVCNGETVFSLHLAGQKHASMVASASNGMKPTVDPNLDPNANATPNPNPMVGYNRAKLRIPNGASKKQKKHKVMQSVWCGFCDIECNSEEASKIQKKPKAMQSVLCGICMIECNSEEMLNTHKLGKLHKENMERVNELQDAVAEKPGDSKNDSVAVEPSNPEVSTNGNPAGDKTRTVLGEEDKTMRLKAKRKEGSSSLNTGEDLETKKQKLVELGTN